MVFPPLFVFTFQPKTFILIFFLNVEHSIRCSSTISQQGEQESQARHAN